MYTVEFIPELSDSARKNLGQLPYTNISFLVGDGARGWPHSAGAGIRCHHRFGGSQGNPARTLRAAEARGAA